MYNIKQNTVIIQSISKEFMELKKDKSSYEQDLRGKIGLDETDRLSGLLSVGTESRRIKFDIPMVKNNIKLTLNTGLIQSAAFEGIKKENYGQGTILLDPGRYRVILKGAEGGTGGITNGISNSTRAKIAGFYGMWWDAEIKCNTTFSVDYFLGQRGEHGSYGGSSDNEGGAGGGGGSSILIFNSPVDVISSTTRCGPIRVFPDQQCGNPIEAVYCCGGFGGRGRNLPSGSDTAGEGGGYKNGECISINKSTETGTGQMGATGTSGSRQGGAGGLGWNLRIIEKYVYTFRAKMPWDLNHEKYDIPYQDCRYPYSYKLNRTKSIDGSLEIWYLGSN